MTRPIYELVHNKIGPADDLLDADEATEKLIGRYSTRERAEAAIERLGAKPGFRDWPGGFRVYATDLDHTSWTDGFCDPYDDHPDEG